MLVTLTACSSTSVLQPETSTPIATFTYVPATNTPVPPTATATATFTNTPTSSPTMTLTSTPTLMPTLEPTSTATQTPTETAQLGIAEGLIVKYLVHLGTGGPVGCGDSLVPVSAGFLRTGDINEDVKIALNSLFSTGTKYVGDLYNPLYQSKVRVESVRLNKSTGNVYVQLTGSFSKPKEDCDKLLYRAQVWSTARQFPEVRLATIRMNQYLLGDLLVVFDN